MTSMTWSRKPVVSLLSEWPTNIDQAWSGLPARHDERFRRMWHFYLDSARAGFEYRRRQTRQLVLSPRGVSGEHRRFP